MYSFPCAKRNVYNCWHWFVSRAKVLQVQVCTHWSMRFVVDTSSYFVAHTLQITQFRNIIKILRRSRMDPVRVCTFCPCLPWFPPSVQRYIHYMEKSTGTHLYIRGWARPGVGNLEHLKSHLVPVSTKEKTLAAANPFWHLKWKHCIYCLLLCCV